VFHLTRYSTASFDEAVLVKSHIGLRPQRTRIPFLDLAKVFTSRDIAFVRFCLRYIVVKVPFRFHHFFILAFSSLCPIRSIGLGGCQVEQSLFPPGQEFLLFALKCFIHDGLVCLCNTGRPNPSRAEAPYVLLALVNDVLICGKDG
jgi:hypothetical protein